MTIRNESNANWIFLILLLCVFSVISTTFLSTAMAKEGLIASVSDSVNHPIYSNYKFNNAEDVINVGVQPIYLPTNFISETMKRDTVLHKSLSKMGMKIEYYAFLKGDDVNFFIQRGNIDVGIGGDMPAITAAATLDIIIPTLIQQGFTSIIARHYMLIKELKGKNIGYAFGSNAHYALLKVLSSAGLSEAQVNLIPMEVHEMPIALQAGKIEAFSAWEPISTISLIKHPENVVIHRYLSSGYMYFTRAFSDKYPEIVKQIVAAEIRALRWRQNNRQNLLKASEWAIQASESLTNRKSEISVKHNMSLAESDILGLNPAPIIPEKNLMQNGSLYMEFEFLKTLGKIPASTNWDKAHNSFDLQIILDVLANSKEYKLNEFNYIIEKDKNES